MSRNLGIPGTSAPPPATRAAEPGWRDPRLWIGVLLLTGSVVAGARLLAAADDTVAVWALAGDRGSGSALSGADLTTTRVRFDDETDIDRYFLAEEPLPDGLLLVRPAGGGELLARSAVGSADEVGLLRVPLEVDPNRVPPDVSTGSVVDVWVADGAGVGSQPGGGAADEGPAGPALSEVTVVAAPELDDAFAITGTRQLVVAVEDERAVEFERLLASLEEPVVRILQRS